jgi:hypothetical protein
MPSAFRPSLYAPIKDIWVAPAAASRVRLDIGGGGKGSRAKFLSLDEARSLALTLLAATEKPN